MGVRISPGWLFGVAAVPYGLAALTPVAQAPADVSFEANAEWVFKAYCVSCHSGAGSPGGLDLSTVEGILRGGVSGPLFRPGKPDESILLHRVQGLHGKPQMPKGFAPLDAERIAGLRRWILAGGSTKRSGVAHWAYRGPVRPTPPRPKRLKTVTHPIDCFVLSKLESAGLTLSREAEKEVLFRRVNLDLTGLPPTIEAIDAFLSDKRPGAYERAVDRLLASPHYGERQARIWLDLARYADTNGYEADRSRTAYKYRDWVIDAFNRNMPYDRFSIEQLAGDLLPNASLDQRIATGFHRNAMFNEEGGVDPEESMFETLLDRVGTTSTVWMGSTMACARCHDHKFDPFTQRDFYQMYAFFNNNRYQAAGDPNVGQRKFYEPSIPVPSPDEAKTQQILTERISALKSKAKLAATDVEAFKRDARAAQWFKPETKVASASGGTFKQLPDGSVLADSPVPDRDNYTVRLSLPAGRWTGLKLTVLPDPSLPAGGPGRATSGNFILTRIKVLQAGKPVAWEADVSFVQQGYTLADLAGGRNETGGWAIYPIQAQPHELVIEFKEPVLGPIVDLEVGLEMQSKAWPQHVIGRFQIQATQAPNPSRFALSEAASQAVATDTPTKEQSAALRTHVEKNDPVKKQLAAAQQQLDQLRARIPTAMVLSDRQAQGPLKAPIFRRGEFLNKGELVEAGSPSFMPSMSAGLPRTRLGLARWLFSKEHPLTARVQVNRMWASYFGRGLVETEEDFGTQGSPPTHPGLLDWLACELRDSGWDLKHVHRLIVTSATYRQTAVASAQALERDPGNMLLARGPRFRMEAEMIRDNALTAAGLLNPKVGGPSVMPFQPEGIWDSPYSGEAWRVVSSTERHRRGLYVYWKRTAPYPSFMAFDSTSREACTVRRTRTNTPLQALALLNDAAYMECASALAARLPADGDDRHRVAWAFRACTGRRPEQNERDRLLKLVDSLRRRYGRDMAAAEKLATRMDQAERSKMVERATWTMLCNVVLNLDETISKG